jgi:hypothetical protein
MYLSLCVYQKSLYIMSSSHYPEAPQNTQSYPMINNKSLNDPVCCSDTAESKVHSSLANILGLTSLSLRTIISIF